MPDSLVGFVDEALPSIDEVVLLGPPLLLYAVLWAWLVGYLRTAREVRTAYTRKIYHFAIFTLAGVVQLVWGLSAVMLFGTITALCVLFAVFRGDGFPFYEAMARPSDAPRRSMFVLVPLATTALGGVLSNLVFAPVAYVGYLVCGWGDAVAEPVGARWGRHRYRVPSLAGVAATRSLEGSASVLLVGSVAAFLGLWGAGVAPATAAATAAGAGCAATLVEAFSNHGIDNLTIQLAASAAAFYLL